MKEKKTICCSHATLRIYDTEFALKLEKLLKECGMNKQDFFLMLVTEGYKAISRRNDSFSSVNLKEESKELSKKLDNVHDLIISSYVNEDKKLDDIKHRNENLLMLISAIYNMVLCDLDSELQEEAERGLFDQVPSRFNKRVRDLI